MQSSAEFDGYVARLERVARAAPGKYRARVFLFGMLGYVYVFGVLATLVALMVGIGAFVGVAIFVKLGIPLGVLAWTILKAMWVRIDAPDGKELAPADAPRLFAEVEAIRKGVDAPRAHHVLLTDDFNAAVSQVPRLGMFGWHRNYLLLGVPLMHALPADEFRAVLAHEFGHLSRAHGRTGAWIYRIRATWARILERLKEDQHGATFIFERFFAWYAPRFAAYSFVLARAQEFEADARAAALVGHGPMASALARLRVRDHQMEGTFWPGLWRRAVDEPEPPSDAYTALVSSFQAPLDAGEAETLLFQALAEPTRSGDTHPALADRIAALGVAPGPGVLNEVARVPSAAETYLDGPAREMVQRMNRSWREAARPAWTERHQHVEQASARLAELERKAEEAPLELAEAKERAWIVGDLRGGAAALPYYQALAEADPDDAQVRSILGHLLLDHGDEEGLPHLEAAMAADLSLVPPGCGAAHAFLRRAGRLEEAERYWTRLQEHEDQMAAAAAERHPANTRPRDVFLPHGLGNEAVGAMVEALRLHRDVASAYLVRKEVRLFPEHPLYVLAVVPDWSWKRREAGNHTALLIQRLIEQVPFPGETVVLTLEADLKKLRKPIAAVPGSDVYVRGRREAAAPA
jgi:Zn-dependent protease with chaperone function